MRTIEVAQCSKDGNPVIHQDVGETQARGIQEVGKTQVPKSRAGKRDGTLQTGRTRISVVRKLSEYNRRDNFSTDFPYQIWCQRENNNYGNFRGRFGSGVTNQYANYAKNLPSLSMTVANTLMSKGPLEIFSGSVNNKSCTVLRNTGCSAISIDKKIT
ncbi:hypothetical protein PoB_001997800 [Plakobranchus ocellatus]|uniref:Uncharacterized protein n=1 Tax=Plakobranchus ocellatus TaxID=259542 RepID=A0AAV3ZG92_9GAST|nr:hypothetical protein PoB_001997800 [Plakobranchus ocellatus]